MELRSKLNKQYEFVYTADKGWLNKVIPIKSTNKTKLNKINWENRDMEYCNQINKVLKDLKSINPPIRASKSLITKSIGIQSNIYKNTDKLPKATKLLLTKAESVEDF